MDQKSERPNPEAKRLNFQLDFLKLEFEAINQAIGRLDGTTQATKNWAVVIWAGAVALVLGKPEMRRYILLTAALPLLFWFIDAQWRRIQRTFIYRTILISRFLNDERLIESFRMNRVIGIAVLDPRAQLQRDNAEYKAFVSLRKTMRFKEVGVFYLGLCLLSVLTSLALWLL